jgi:hypothetical protein
MRLTLIFVLLFAAACSKVSEEQLPTPERQEELPNPNTPLPGGRSE